MIVSSDPPEVMWIENGKHRCFEQIATICAAYTLTLEAATRRKGQIPVELPLLQLGCPRAGLSIRIALGGMMDAIESGVLPSKLGMVVAPKSVVEFPPGSFDVKGLKGLILGLQGANFSLFAERGCDWVRRHYSTDYNNWPPVANFSRVVRNAIVHGGKVNIQSPRAAPVAWRGLSITHKDHGKAIIQPDYLGAADLIALMLDLDLELNLLGAPFDLDN